MLGGKVALTIYKGTILPILDYANIVLSLASKSHSEILQQVQNQALRIIYRNSDGMNTQDMHVEAKLFALEQRVANQVLCLIYHRSLAIDLFPQADSLGITRSNPKSNLKSCYPEPNVLKGFFSILGSNYGMSLQQTYRRV